MGPAGACGQLERRDRVPLETAQGSAPSGWLVVGRVRWVASLRTFVQHSPAPLPLRITPPHPTTPPPPSLATILSIVRDVGYLMDSINASTAMHRLGKVVRRQREANPGGRIARACAEPARQARLVGRARRWLQPWRSSVCGRPSLTVH